MQQVNYPQGGRARSMADLTRPEDLGVLVTISNASVLVVGTTAESTVSLLGESGWSATSCLDGTQALKKLKHSTHHIVLCDLDLTDMDGVRLMSRVHAGHPHVAFVLVTKPRNLRRAMLAMLSGAAGYIQTPLEQDNLTAILESALQRKRLESALADSQLGNAEDGLRKAAAQIA